MMIQISTTQGLCDYCDLGVATDIRDQNGDVLYTGDVVEVVRNDQFADVVYVGMVVFDQHKNFIGTDRFFVEGWLSHDWSDGKYLLRVVDRDCLPANAHFRIVKEMA